MTAIEAVIKIVEMIPGIESLSFCVYAPSYNVKEIKRRNLHISRLLYHNPSKETIWLGRSELTLTNLNKIIDSLEMGTTLALLSKVKTKNETCHLPVIDFDDKNIAGRLKIENFLRSVGQQKGLILLAGRSYHYYGVSLMTDKHWQSFLGDCLLSGLVEPRYIGHRLKDGCGAVRLSACPLRPKTPTVVSILK